MSKILPPRDTITITLHNLEQPPRMNVDMSRPLPFVQAAAVLAQAITVLAQQAILGVQAAVKPLETPEKAQK